MIWLKRIAPFVIILLGYLAYHYYTTVQTTKRLEIQRVHGLVTARLWVAAAEYRDEPEKYLAYRDSLLTEYDLTLDQMNTFLDSYEKTPEEYRWYAKWVDSYVDSLLAVRGSLLPDSALDKPLSGK